MLILGPDSTVKPVPDPGPGSRGILILDPNKSEKSPMFKKKRSYLEEVLG